MQAARGTSLSEEQRVPARPAPPRRRVLLAAVALTWYVADQVTKLLAVDRLSERDRSLVGDLLTLHLVRNPGAAFSTGTEYTLVLSCFAIAAALVVLWVSRRVGSRVWAVALGLLLAGVLGNLTDRLLRAPGPLRGHVVDFLQLPNWPVFNLADIAINVAAGLILLQAFRGSAVDGTPVSGRREPAADVEGPRS